MKIETISNPREEDLEVLSDGIKSYNQEYIPDDIVFEPDTRFAIFVRGEDNEVLGGVRACAYWNYCLLELVWLSGEVRRKGIGTQLLDAAELFARDKGFEYVRTETVDFQALTFYKKLGYTVYGELTDFPKGHTSYCLVKKL